MGSVPCGTSPATAMGTTLGIVVVVAFVLVIGIAATVVTEGSAYEQIGRGGLFVPDEKARRLPTVGTGRAEMEADVRQMLEARNERRSRRGQAPLDVEAELARLLDPAAGTHADDALVDEVRQLVIARNTRRARQGKAPLDVEAEVERELRDFGG